MGLRNTYSNTVMSKSQYIHAPSIEEVNVCVNQARFIAKTLNIKMPPQLKVALPLVEGFRRRETSQASRNRHELIFMTRLWTALRIDAATHLDMHAISTFFASLTKGAVKADSKLEVRARVLIGDLTECILDANHVYDCAMSQGRAFFTKVLPGLGKVIDTTYPTTVTCETFITVPFHTEWHTFCLFNEEQEEFVNTEYKIPSFMRSLFTTFYSQFLNPATACAVRRVSDLYITRESSASDWVRYQLSLKERVPAVQAGIRALKSLRQLCFMFYKLETPFEPETVREISDSFCITDRSLPLGYIVDGDRISRFKHDEDFQYARFVERHLEAQAAEKGSTPPAEADGSHLKCFSAHSYEAKVLRVARYLVRAVLGTVDPRDIQGRHGPGAVATGERGSKKATFTRIYRKLEAMYPFTEYFAFNMTHVCDDVRSMQTRLSVHETATAKVVFVPKDSRGPRMISCEPLEIQWIQQGLMSLMTKTIQAHPLTRASVFFDDQSINQGLARYGSLNKEPVATIDLKDASDRVSVALVEYLFPQTWVEALLSARSDNTLLPDGRIVELRKFAPMGSATCFPVEALCFFALSAAAVYLEDVQGTFPGAPSSRILPSALKRAVSCITVFGDDIIIRAANCGTVIAALESFDLVVNRAKSYQAGLFRESCGVDAFGGVDVTPMRIKRIWDGQSLPTQDALISYVAQSNALFAKGYSWAAWEIERRVQMALESHGEMLIPYTMRTNPPGLAFIRDHKGLYWSPVKEKVRRNQKTLEREVLMYTIVGGVNRSQRLGWEEMLRCESYRTSHLQFGINPNCWRAGVYAIPRCYRVTKRWMPYSQE